jgi:tetrapyrrole methylase family protein/MazG family protein
MARGVTIVGLGPGGPGLLTREAWDLLVGCAEVWVRTARHPAVEALPEIRWRSFDQIYEVEGSFERVYRRIADQVLELARREEGVVYAVPGDPCMGETVTDLVVEAARKEGLRVRILAGVSFLEPTLQLLQLDGISQLFLADAAELATLHHPPFPPSAHALIAQLYSAEVASDVKLVLMNQYPESHPVCLVHAAGTSAAQVQELPLFEIDRRGDLDHLSTLYVPPWPRGSLEELQETVAHLRAPEGCPWDREQTHQSLRANLQEEAYEVLEALDLEDPAALREELGDLLLQVVLQTQIAIEAGEFRMADVVRSIEDKLHRRHPHVFGSVSVRGVGEVLRNWEEIKAAERAEHGESQPSALQGVSPGLAALLQAYLYQQRASRVGFDWTSIEGVREKVEEELREIQQARTPEQQSAEVGDLIFAAVNLARWMGVEPEAALRESNRRFRGRFERMEAQARAEGTSLTRLSPERLDELWQAAKRALP